MLETKSKQNRNAGLNQNDFQTRNGERQRDLSTTKSINLFLTTEESNQRRLLCFEKKVLSFEDQKLHGTMRGKNTKYFLNLENRHCKQGTISQLKLNGNNFVTSNRQILALQCQSQSSLKLTETERLAALKTMETEKTPGWDGSVPAEFYKVF